MSVNRGWTSRSTPRRRGQRDGVYSCFRASWCPRAGGCCAVARVLITSALAATLAVAVGVTALPPPGPPLVGHGHQPQPEQHPHAVPGGSTRLDMRARCGTSATSGSISPHERGTSSFDAAGRNCEFTTGFLASSTSCSPHPRTCVDCRCHPGRRCMGLDPWCSWSMADATGRSIAGIPHGDRTTSRP